MNHFFQISDYVEEIYQVLFAITKEERELMREKYKTKVPEPLTSQFTERVSKEDAILRHASRKRTRTELFPSGTKIIISS